MENGSIADRDQFQLGTLSHIINTKAQGYQELPEWPVDQPDPAVRNVQVTMPWSEEEKPTQKRSKKESAKKASFYSSDSSPAGRVYKVTNNFQIGPCQADWKPGVPFLMCQCDYL